PLASRAAARGLSTFEAGLRLNASSSWSRSEAAMRDSIPATVSAIVVPAPRWPSAISVMRARLPAGTHGGGDERSGDSLVVGAQASGLRFGRGTAIGLQQPVEELIGGDAVGPCGGLEAVERGRRQPRGGGRLRRGGGQARALRSGHGCFRLLFQQTRGQGRDGESDWGEEPTASSKPG